MYLNKPQREQLNQLSLELYGVSSKWRKLIEDPSFRKVTEVYEDPDAPTYVQFSTKTGLPGTIMRTETAIARGLVPADYKPQVVKKTRSEALSFDEIVEALETSIEATYIASMNSEAQSLILAKKMIDKKLSYKLSLIVTDDNKASFDDLKALLADDLKAEVDKFVLDATGENKPKIEGVPLDGEKFLTNLVFVKSHGDASDEEIQAAYDEAREIHRKTLKALQRGLMNVEQSKHGKQRRKNTKPALRDQGGAPKLDDAAGASEVRGTETQD